MVVQVRKSDVYEHILECGEVTAAQVARHFSCTIPYISGIFGRLRRDGKIVSKRGPKHRDAKIWYANPRYYVVGKSGR